MLLAEAVTFDPGLVVALFVGLLLVGGAALAVVVIGVCAGYRSGRDPERTRANAAWRICAVVEAAAIVWMALAGAPFQLIAALLLAPVAAWLAHVVGQQARRTGERHVRQQDRG